MRIVIIVILASIVTSMLYAQIDPPLYAPEFYIHAKNGTPNTTIHFTLEKISVGYCYDADIVPNQFVECDECLPYCSSCEGSTIEVEINASGNNASGQEGWGFCAFEIATKDPPHYGFAVYKLTQVESQNYIYLDTRDIRYSRGLLLGGYDVDFIIRYDGSGDGEFEFDAYTDGTWTTIPMKGLQQIWRGDWDGDGDIDYSFPDVSLFPTDFWSNCLIIGFPPEYIAAPFSLQLIWSKNPNQDNISKYYVHRQIDAGGFIKIGEFNNQTFDYKDKSILFTGDGSSTVSYKVTSFNGIESTPTNIASQEYDFEYNQLFQGCSEMGSPFY